MRRSVSSLAVVALFAGASFAHADTVRLSNFTFASNNQAATSISVGTNPSYSGSAGQFTGTLNGSSFTTYCTDLYQSFSFNTTYTNYSVLSGATAWGAAKSVEMDHLMSYLVTHAPTDRDSSAAAQAAVWEVLYETTGSYSLNTGSFTASSGDWGAAIDMYTMDWNAINATPITVHADALRSTTNQDFVVLTPVPEPSTWALMIGGLMGVGFTARRRMR